MINMLLIGDSCSSNISLLFLLLPLDCPNTKLPMAAAEGSGCIQSSPLWTPGDSWPLAPSVALCLCVLSQALGQAGHQLPAFCLATLKTGGCLGLQSVLETPQEILPLSSDFLFTMTFWDVLPSQCLILLLCHIDFESF